MKTDPIVLGWLELGPVAVSLARDPMRATAALNNWKRLYPQHPANDSVLASASTQIAAASEFPDQIALLLPLSGRAEAVGAAVRDGFIAAYLEQDPAKRPRLRIYDVSSATVSGAYNQAIRGGEGDGRRLCRRTADQGRRRRRGALEQRPRPGAGLEFFGRLGGHARQFLSIRPLAGG